MISIIIAAFAFIQAARTAPHFPQNNEPNILHRGEMASNRNLLLHNNPSHCSLEEVASLIGMQELQGMLEAFAARKGISPFAVLSRLLSRIRSRQEVEEAFLNTLEGAALQELLNPAIEVSVQKPAHAQPPPSSGAPYALLPEMQSKAILEEEPPLFIFPSSKSSQNTLNHLPPVDKTDNLVIHEPPIPMANRPHSSIISPAVFPLFNPNRTLRPPPDAVVHVNSGHLVNTIPDVTVAVSPLMTLVEALKQAEVKYQNALGLDPSSDVISYAHAPNINCFVISQVDDVRRNDSSVWKVTVTDREGQELYDDICIPEENEIPVKPGTVISLSYVRL